MQAAPRSHLCIQRRLALPWLANRETAAATASASAAAASSSAVCRRLGTLPRIAMLRHAGWKHIGLRMLQAAGKKLCPVQTHAE